jgi:hypothetical protein
VVAEFAVRLFRQAKPAGLGRIRLPFNDERLLHAMLPWRAAALVRMHLHKKIQGSISRKIPVAFRKPSV